MCQALAEAWELCRVPETSDYDPRLRNALAVAADVFEADVGPMDSISQLPMTVAEAMNRIYTVGNVHSLASYLVEHMKLLFSNSNVESVYLQPVGGESAVFGRLSQKKLVLVIPPEYRLTGFWIDVDLVSGPNGSEAVMSQKDFADRGLEFFSDLARDAASVSWIAFPQYRLALGRRSLVEPWQPLPRPGTGV